MKNKPDFLILVLLVFGLGVLSTGFASVAQSLSGQPESGVQAVVLQNSLDVTLVSKASQQ